MCAERVSGISLYYEVRRAIPDDLHYRINVLNLQGFGKDNCAVGQDGRKVKNNSAPAGEWGVFWPSCQFVIQNPLN
jgi:hypothetical protein